MLRKKIPIFAMIAILLSGVVILFSGDADQDLAQKLANKQPAGGKLPPNPTSDRGEQSRQLSEETFATKPQTGRSWTVESPKAQSVMTVVSLPFDPTRGPEPQSTDGHQKHPTTITNPGFMGADACAQCHPKKHDGFVQTAHHRTSAPLTSEPSHGSFAAPDNVMPSADPHLFFTMRKRDDHIVQEITLADWSLDIPMNIVVGTAKVGQSFLYWHDDALYQAYVSYLTKSDKWIPSPGFPNTEAIYTRPIRAGCLECHITYIERVKQPNHYAPESAIWGISCERCHGPGRQHVEFHRENPDEKQSKFMTHPGDLDRERQLDICGQCHSGGFSLRKNAFTFRPGDDVNDFHRHLQTESDEVGGIHTANQLTRLKMSRCFQQSEMTCTTCHNPHEDQRGESAVFTQSCLGCHESQHCGMATELGDRVSQNCIACHMPISLNEDMSDIGSDDLQSLMLDHYIRVDESATQNYLSQ